MDKTNRIYSVELSVDADGYRMGKVNGKDVPFADAVLILGRRGSPDRVPYIPPGAPGYQPKTAPFYGMWSHKVNLLPENEIAHTREFRCTDCCKETLLTISDLGLNGDERVDLSCGCRVRLARIRERAKAGKIV